MEGHWEQQTQAWPSLTNPFEKAVLSSSLKPASHSFFFLTQSFFFMGLVCTILYYNFQNYTGIAGYIETEQLLNRLMNCVG